MYLWIAALLLLAAFEPSADHFTICPFHHLGFSFCPGCGLGKSISYLLQGDVNHSLTAHPLGFFALGVLIYRIYQLIKNNHKSYGQNY
jgi:hypothetical protein